MQNIYQTFEFEKIKEKILVYSKTERGREYINQLEIVPSFDELNNLLEDIKEVSSLIQRYGEMPISPSLNAVRIINDAKKFALLTPRDLEMIAQDVITSGQILSFVRKIENMYPRVKAKVDDFIDLSNLEKEIHRVINTAQAIKDDASDELFSIRTKLKKAEKNLQDKIATIALSYSSYLNSESATLRDGHLVLPVKTAFKSRVPGIVYDVSDSGNTTFIEPLEIVQINNEITALKVEEQEECRKILKALTGLVLLQEGEILSNNQVIAELDFLSAKALYGNEINAEVATLVKEPTLTYKSARHPLIDPLKVVANSYHLDEEKRIVIISGPNAGGKTVSLKTIGLLTLMNQCGLMVSAKEATLSYFKHIFVDIGDNQSLSDNLSTFSAHMSHLSEIIALAGGKDLILIDELGTGTDPKEGEALAFAITKYLERKNSFAFISSHFDALKEYAFLSEHLDNSSMLFNEEKLLPTYTFKQGAPGKSYALDVATRYGIKEEIVKEAKDFLVSKGTSGTDELTTILLKKINEASLKEKELAKREEDIAKKEKRIEIDQDNLDKKRDKLLEDVNTKKSKIIEEAKKEVDAIMSELSTSDLKLHEVIELRKRLDALDDDTKEVEIFDEPIKVDDFVCVPSLDLSGKVVSIKGNKAKIRSDSGISFDCELSKLHKIDKKKEATPVKKQSKHYEDIINTSLSLELNLIGEHVEEAMIKLSKYIDACRMKHLTQVRIIHGFGSGALRKATHDYLKTQKDLTYRLGDEYEGGGGATVVMFNGKK